MNMQIMATALQKATTGGPLRDMISQATVKVEKEAAEVQERAAAALQRQQVEETARGHKRRQDAWAKEYDRQIKLAGRKGFGSLKPCSFPAWKPATPALACGKPCRIKWGLSSGNHDVVIVAFEYPQPLVGLEGKTTTLGIFPLSDLTPCDCRGYIHKYGCTPERQPRKKGKGEGKSAPKPQPEKEK